MKIGQEQETDEIKRGENDGRADGTEVAEQIFVHHQPDPAPNGSRVIVPLPVGEESHRFVQIEQAHAAQQQSGRPDPAAMEVGHPMKQITEAETEEENRQKISAGAEQKKEQETNPGADLADPVMGGEVGLGAVDGDVPGIVREQSDEREHGHRDERDADNVAKAARVDLAGRCFTSHGRKPKARHFKVQLAVCPGPSG